MSGPLSNPYMFKSAAGAGGFYTHQIANSVRLGDSGYLKRTPSGAGNRATWTFSTWIKVTVLGTSTNSDQPGGILNAGTGSGNQDTFYRLNYSQTKLFSSSGAANFFFSNSLYRDISSWYNVVWKHGSGTSTVYVNGVAASGATASVSGNTAINNSVEHVIGGSSGTLGETPLKAYLAETIMIDGTALDPDSFGETKNGVWIPKDVSGLTFGTNGFHLDYADSSALGNDVSGNNNDWTPVNLSAHDQILDSPTFGSEGSANYPTINVLDPTVDTSAISNGNLQITEGNQRGGKATFAVPLTGKWYWEAYCYADSAQEMWNGITGITANSSGDGRGGSSNSNTYGASWSQYSGSNYYIRKYIGGTESAESGSFGTTKHTILGIAINRDDNEAKFYKDNALQFTATISATQEYFPAGGMGGGTNATTIQVWNFGQDGTFAGNKTAQGNADGNGYGNFYYSPPSGHLALNSANLPTADAVDPAQTDDNYPQKLFQALTYTGTGSSGSITTVLQPDFIWMKNRGTTKRHYVVDSNRGINSTSPYLHPDQTVSEGTGNSTGVSGVSSTSISFGGGLDYVNASSNTYVSWHWRANGGTTSSNSNGSITSTVQVDPSGCFSIVTYTGQSASRTVGHGLSTAPDFIIVKSRDNTRNWAVYYGDTGKAAQLNNYNAADTGSYWNSTAPTSSVFSVADVSETGKSENYVAYCFANCEGYIKSGTYVGNGSTDGAFVYTGLRPAWIMCKRVDSSSFGNWRIMDNARDPNNVGDKSSLPNSSSAEESGSSNYVDLLSNGFKLRNTQNWNSSGGTYIYLAMAHNPFKYATAR